MKPAISSEGARIVARYHVQSDGRSIERRAQAIAVEQSVEMPVSAIDDPFVRAEIVARVERIVELSAGLFEVDVSLAQATVGADPGQLMSMLFGNTSLHEDVVLHDAEFPIELVRTLGGPRHGLEGLRRRVGASPRALTCAPIKPQGLSPERLAQLAMRYASGGIDFIKDDHGLAEQPYAPFTARVAAVTEVLHQQKKRTGHLAAYAPSLSGDLDAMRGQICAAKAVGIDAVLVAPMLAGLSNFHRLVRDNPGVAFIAHPGMAGAARIAPPFLLGKLFRLLGADAVIFPNFGGRFGYSRQTCRALARAALENSQPLRPCAPVPAGGMTLARVGEMLDFYGAEVMLLIGGALLETGERLSEAVRAFVAEVRNHPYLSGQTANSTAEIK